MKKHVAHVLVFLLSLMMFSGMAEAAYIGAMITGIDTYGQAWLDITEADFHGAGFDLGDVVTVTCGSYTGDMPVFNGYYADRGKCMLRVDPQKGDICLCINYGDFSEFAGIVAGDAVTIAMEEKGGALATQEINELVYSNNRADFASDDVRKILTELKNREYIQRIGSNKTGYRKINPIAVS